MAPKHDANFVFKLSINNSGYTSKVWVFIMSFYSPMYGLYGTDGMMHLVEEMKDASKQAPVCIRIRLRYVFLMLTFIDLSESSSGP
jgi:hypothetical protein